MDSKNPVNIFLFILKTKASYDTSHNKFVNHKFSKNKNETRNFFVKSYNGIHLTTTFIPFDKKINKYLKIYVTN